MKIQWEKRDLVLQVREQSGDMLLVRYPRWGLEMGSFTIMILWKIITLLTKCTQFLSLESQRLTHLRLFALITESALFKPLTLRGIRIMQRIAIFLLVLLTIWTLEGVCGIIIENNASSLLTAECQHKFTRSLEWTQRTKML